MKTTQNRESFLQRLRTPLIQGCGSGSGPFSVEAEARKFFRFHIRGKNGGRKEIGSAILWRRTNRGSINIKKRERGGVV